MGLLQLAYLVLMSVMKRAKIVISIYLSNGKILHSLTYLTLSV